jgi:hypothetical protein
VSLTSGPAAAGSGTVDVTDRSGRLVGVVVQGAAGASLWKVDASGAAVPVTDNGGSLTIDSPQLPTLAAGRLPVDGSGVTQPVSGTFWQATQPVSAASLPLPAGAAQEHATAASPHSARLTDGATYLGSTSQRLHVADGGVALKVDGSAVTQPVSAASLPLPAGAALDATLTSGSQKAIARGGAKGATTAADVTSTAEGTDHQAQDVQLYHGGAAINPQTIRALTAADIVTVAQGAAGASLWKVDASGAAVPITDNGGSLTVDSGQLPAALGTNGALKVEGVASGTAQPVSGTFWQATQPVSLATNTPDVTDRATREVGRARLWDGTDEATVIPRGTAAASTDKGLAVVVLPARQPTYQCVTAEITSGTAIATAQNLTFFHPNTLAKDVFIVEIGVNVRIVQTAGTFGWELQFFTAEGGTPGGTALTPQPLNLGDAASGLTVRTSPTGAVTVAGQTFQRASFPLPAAATPFDGSSNHGTIIFRAETPEEGITLRSGQAEGLLVRQNIIATLTTAPVFNIYARYIERA